MPPFSDTLAVNRLPLNEHRDVYMVVLTAILKLKGIGVLCSSLRDVCPTMRINI
jgi:hypothetical protein